jgi:hypothetical protein
VGGGSVRQAAIRLLAVWLVLGCAHPSEAPQVEPAEAAKPAALDAPEAEPGAPAAAGAGVTAAAPGPAQLLANPPRGPFGYSLVASEDGEPLDIEGFLLYDDCESCHERQWEELDGSMHTLAHTDPLYRASAELARAEVGEEIYTFCAGCHSPQGVVTGLIPGTPESELPDEAIAGILCDVCHQVSLLTGTTGPWGEPGNASLVLSPDEDRKFGPPGGDDETTDHVIETREYLDRSEFCASCHTVIHPLNGLRLEHTYQEWKESIYAEKDIHCQDCHMRSVEGAVKVAETLKPVTVIGQSEPTGDDREIHPHYFVGANVNAEVLGGSVRHGAMAEARLQSAAELEIEPLDSVAARGTLEFAVVVHNVAAGHHLPTSLIELREMWVDVQVIAKDGRVLFHSGELEPDGEIPEDAMRFGAVGANADGKVTHKPWEVAQFVYKRLIPAKGSERDSFRVAVPEDLAGPLRIQARLFYRSASPEALAALMGDAAFEPRQVEMARAEASVPLR